MVINNLKRLELKYQTHRRIADAIFRHLSPIFSIDENAQNFVTYENVSIYFDDESMRSYREKHEGDNVRNKARLRMSRPSGQKEFTRSQVEIKERRGVETLKRSFPVEKNNQQWAIENVKEYMLKKHSIYFNDFLYPSVGVRYLRTAINSSIVPGVRITFDTDIKSFHDFHDLENIKAHSLILPIADSLIEIKSKRGVPAIIGHLIQTYRLQRVTYSKYAKALEAMHDVLSGYIATPEYFRHERR